MSAQVHALKAINTRVEAPEDGAALFGPVPFKVFTLASGAIGMPLLPFFFGALIGRGKRVYLVAWAIRLGGRKAEAMLRKHIEPIGWIALALLAAAIAYLVFSGGSA